MIAVDHVRFSTVGSDNNERDFHVGGLRFRRLLMSLQDITDWRRFAEKVEIGI